MSVLQNKVSLLIPYLSILYIFTPYLCRVRYQDINKAFFWLKKAAEQGEGVAQLHYGLMFAKGRGVDQNSIEALHWVSRAHRKNIDESEQAMYAIYTDAIKKSAHYPTERMKFLQMSTVIPFPKAQYDMGSLSLALFNSSKVESERNEAIIDAYKWIRIANSDSIVPGKWNKPKEWKNMELEIKNKMTIDQIDKAHKLIDKFFAVQTEVYNKIESKEP